jgi:mono/diheme cytochrome c family protein
LSNSARAARAVVATFAIAAAAFASTAPAEAIPIFAQRYGLQCATCHSVLPELNAFGNAFRNNGYRIAGLPKHGTTIVALREQIGYTPVPTDGTTRKTVPAGAALAAAEVGRVEAFVHETLGSEGSSASLFLGYLAYRDAHSGVLYRAGLVELPLEHSPAQRNDTLTTYGYEGTLVGLNDLTLATPRWALEAERDVGVARLAATVAFANAAGSAYGGKPVVTGRSESFAAPEVGLFARVPLGDALRVGIDVLSGSRAIAVAGGVPFDDPYARVGTSLEAHAGRLELLAAQWWGRDRNADGAGGAIDSDGGYVRVRWRLGEHAFVGLREDAAAAPASTRALLWYAEALVTPHARMLVQQRRPIPGGPTTMQAALTVALPWPRGK